MLNLYEYEESSTENILNFLEDERISDKLWIPHQIGLEYSRNRLKVIWKQEAFYNELTGMISSQQDSLNKDKNKLKKEWNDLQSEHRYLDLKGMFNKLDEGFGELSKIFDKVKADIKENKRNNPKLSDNDIIYERLDKIYTKDKIGSPYKTKERLIEIYSEGEHRYRNEIPPGFNDDKFGDLILWFQMMDYVKVEEQPIIFVTDDRKDDWWLKKNKNTHIGPHPNLVQEFMYETNQLVHIYLPKGFLKWGNKYLNESKLEDKTITNVETFKPGIRPSEIIYNELGPALGMSTLGVVAELSRQSEEQRKALLNLNMSSTLGVVAELSRQAEEQRKALLNLNHRLLPHGLTDETTDDEANKDEEKSEGEEE